MLPNDTLSGQSLNICLALDNISLSREPDTVFSIVTKTLVLVISEFTRPLAGSGNAGSFSFYLDTNLELDDSASF